MTEDIIGLLAEQKIVAAIEAGEFDNLPGRGKPLPPDVASSAPAAERVGYKLLKNAGILPVEMDIKQEIGRLEQTLQRETAEAARRQIARKIAEKTALFNILMERRRRK